MDEQSKETEQLINGNQKKDPDIDIQDATPVDRRSRLRPKSAKSIRDIFSDENVPNEEAISKLNEKTNFHKVRSMDKFISRRYFFNLNTMRLHYEPSIKSFMCREVPYIDLCDLAEVRSGWQSDRFNVIEAKFRRKLHASIGPKNLPDLEEDNCFSLVFDNGMKTEDLVAPNKDIRNMWVKGLNYLIASYRDQLNNDEHVIWLKKQFREADKNHNQNLSFNEIICLLNHMNIALNEKHAKTFFMRAHKRKINLRELKGEVTLDQDEFLIFYDMINQRPELDKLFQDYSVIGTDIMGPEELRDFLINEQKMTKVTLADCEAYIQRYEPNESDNPGYLTIKGFRYLFKSIDFDIFNRSHRVVCEDTSQSLSDYYIASSHNTYLMMGQLTGSSSIEAYRLALERGCRCIELDVWDGDDGEPIIYHGYTLTTKILLRDVLKTIRKYAFKTSQYPVILSMENHLSIDQQIVMASLMKDILKDYLYDGPVDPNKSHLPSPETLVRKILIKGKKLPKIKPKKLIGLRKALDLNAINESDPQLDEEIINDEEEEEADDSDDEMSSSDDDMYDQTIDDIKTTVGNKNGIKNTTKLSIKEDNKDGMKSMERNNTYPSSHQRDNNKNVRSTTSPALNNTHLALGVTASVPPKATIDEINASKKHKLAKDFSDLITYCVAKKFVSFDDGLNERKWKYYEMVSLEETKSEGFKKNKDEEKKYVKFTKKHLVRVYPRGTRTDSSNYNPIPHWNMGAQLVALNYQTPDKAMLFNEALFAMNGRCGYVLKSDYLRKGKEYGMSGRTSVINAPTSKVKKVKVTIISGQYIPKPGNTLDGEIVDPYVKLRVYGHEADSGTSFKTQPVKNNGFNPIWNESIEFVIRLPDMAFIYFAVKDHSTAGKNIILGQYMLAFPAIMEGYRTINLVGTDLKPLSPATLLVHIDYKDVADYWSPE